MYKIDIATKELDVLHARHGTDHPILLILVVPRDSSTITIVEVVLSTPTAPRVIIPTQMDLLAEIWHALQHTTTTIGLMIAKFMPTTEAILTIGIQCTGISLPTATTAAIVRRTATGQSNVLTNIMILSDSGVFYTMEETIVTHPTRLPNVQANSSTIIMTTGTALIVQSAT